MDGQSPNLQRETRIDVSNASMGPHDGSTMMLKQWANIQSTNYLYQNKRQCKTVASPTESDDTIQIR